MNSIRQLLPITLLLIGAASIQAQTILFQRPFQIAIDDLGWNRGSSLGDQGGPWRAGVKRTFDVKDYQAVVDIGKGAGTRMQGLFILSEMDRLGIVAQYPHMTYQQAKWDNSENISRLQLDIMNFVKNNADYLEFGYHGVGHEYWDSTGRRTRAEYYNTDENTPRPEALMRQNLDVFENIMDQYGMGRKDGHSFPESFVPPAYGYYWNPTGSYSTGSIMSERGLKYVNTNFDYIRELNPPEMGSAGFDNGVLVVDRQNEGNPWFEYASFPTIPITEYRTDIIETHFPNLLAQDDFLQADVTKKWVDLYAEIQNSPDQYVAKNSEQFNSQWLYKRHATVTETKPGEVRIDNRNMPDEAYTHDLLGTMVLTVKLAEGTHVSSATLDGKPIPAYFEDAGYGFLYLPRLEKKNHVLAYTVGNTTMPFHVYLDGTYNVYGTDIQRNATTIDLKMYGTQDVVIQTRAVKSVTSDNPRLTVESQTYDAAKGTLTLSVKGHDIQGERGKLTLRY